MFGARYKPQPPMGGDFKPMGPTPAMQPVMQQSAEVPKKQGVNWLGVLADALAGAAGQPGQYLAGIQEQRKRADELANDQRRRSLDMSDWQAKQQWSIDNEPPKVNDTERDFAWYKGLSEPDRAIYAKMRPQYRQGPDGQFYAIAPQEGQYNDDDWNNAKPVGGGVSNDPSGFPR